MLQAGAASAQCTPDAPANGATVTCTGTIASGVLHGLTSDVTLTVEAAGLVENIGDAPSIDLGRNADLTVSGSVSSRLADAIRVGDNATVTVEEPFGSVLATGAPGADVDGIQGQDGLDLDLSGRVMAGNYGVVAGNDALVILRPTARLGAGSDGLHLGRNARVDTKAGSIIDTGTSTYMDARGIRVDNDARMALRGTITATHNAVQAGEIATITNLGRIANIQTQAMIDAGTAAQDGIDLEQGFVENGSDTFTTAEITATFGHAIHFRVATTDISSTVDNYGLIDGGNHAVATDPLNVGGQWIINRATGRITGGSGLALTLGAGEDRYDHLAGATLTGGIDFGPGDDSLQVFGLPEGRLGGDGAVVDGGAGNDTAVFHDVTIDQIAGTVSGLTVDLRLGGLPQPFRVTLVNVESVAFGGTTYTLDALAARLR
ncbi:MAG: hypothetical protein MUF73_10910 [Rhodobacteraceae bacterium]|nr:hypothetical protein [Paracoccaceae bacterium]